MAPDLSAKKTSLGIALLIGKDRRVAVNIMPLPEEPREGIFRESEKTDTVKDKDGVHEFYQNHSLAFKCGSTLDQSNQWHC